MARFSWFPELISYGLALIALVTAICFLKWRDGKPLPNWPGLFTVNFVLSAVTTVLKAAMLLPVAEGLSELKWLWYTEARLVTDLDDFDLASRGPRGSFRFLWRFPHNKLACFGSAIIFAGLFIDPVTQLVVQNEDRLVEEGGIGLMYRTNNYTLNGTVDSQLTSYGYGNGALLPSIYQGLLDPPANASAAMSFDCRTGNCTFDSYSSLAICSTVTDISHLVQCYGRDPNLLGEFCTLPSGLSFTFEYPLSTWVPTSMTLNKTQWPIFEMEILMLVLNSTSCKAVRRYDDPACETKPLALKVGLHACIHTYHSSLISQFQLQENLNSTIEIPLAFAPRNAKQAAYYSLAGGLPSTVGLDCSPSSSRQGNKTQATGLLKDGRRYVIHYDGPSVDIWETARSVDNTVPDAEIEYFDPGCTWSFASDATYTIEGDLSEKFFGSQDTQNETWSVNDTGESRTPGAHRISIIAEEFDDEGRYLSVFGDAWLVRLYAGGTVNLTSVTTYMEGLANAMTAAIRRHGDNSNSSPAIGKLLINKTVIRFEWRYLMFNVVLLLSTIVFLTATYVRAHKLTGSRAGSDERGAWKSSSLPLLWCGLEDDARRKYGVQDYVQGEMSHSSDMLEVKLLRVMDVPPKHGEAITASEEVEVNPRQGRWVLRASHHHPNRCKASRVRRILLWLADYIPI